MLELELLIRLILPKFLVFSVRDSQPIDNSSHMSKAGRLEDLIGWDVVRPITGQQGCPCDQPARYKREQQVHDDLLISISYRAHLLSSSPTRRLLFAACGCNHLDRIVMEDWNKNVSRTLWVSYTWLGADCCSPIFNNYALICQILRDWGFLFAILFITISRHLMCTFLVKICNRMFLSSRL